MQQDNPWTHIQTKKVYQDQWIIVNQDEVIRPDNQPGTYTYIDSKNSVMIIAVDDSEEIYLERTYRYPTKSWGWELPGGGIDNKTEHESAQAELAEEIGYSARKWEFLNKMSVYNGLVTGSIYFYSAKELRKIDAVSADDSEITNTGRFFSLKNINEMILNSDITDSQTVAGIHLFELSRN